MEDNIPKYLQISNNEQISNNDTEENEILILNFTETQLDDNKQEDMKIKGYQLYRGDRRGNIWRRYCNMCQRII